MSLAIDASIITQPLSGVQYAVKEQILALLQQQQKIACHIFCHDKDITNLAKETTTPYQTLPQIYQKKLARIFWQQFYLPYQLKSNHNNCLYAPAYTAPHNCPIPYLLFIHDLIAITHPKFCSLTNSIHMRILMPKSIKNAHKIFISSHYIADQLIKLFNIPNNRIIENPLGVNYQFFSNTNNNCSLSKQLNNRPYILFVGNIEPKKGINTILAAYTNSKIEKTHNLIIAGRVAWKSQTIINKIKNYQGNGKIILTGRVNRKQLRELYQQATIFIFPSIIEGFGLPILEAMSAGTPVIHSNHPALMQTANKAGLAIEINNPQALQNSILKLLNNQQQRNEMAEQGKLHAQTMSWQKNAQTILQTAKEVI